MDAFSIANLVGSLILQHKGILFFVGASLITLNCIDLIIRKITGVVNGFDDLKQHLKI